MERLCFHCNNAPIVLAKETKKPLYSLKMERSTLDLLLWKNIGAQQGCVCVFGNTGQDSFVIPRVIYMMEWNWLHIVLHYFVEVNFYS